MATDRLGRRLLRGAVPSRYRPHVFGALRSIWYAGNNVSCPCCSGHFRAFRLQGRVCPRCSSHGRHRLLWLYLDLDPELLSSAESILHLAPEYSLRRLLSRLEGVKYVTADLDSPLADDAVDIRSLPYADGSFGALICSHVLEHVDDDRGAMRELHRVLRPGGWAIVMAPVEPGRETTLEDPDAIDDVQRLRLFGQEDHVRLYGSDLAQRLEEAGFEVRVDRFADELPPEIVQRMRLRVEEDPIFFCRRPRSERP